MVHFKRDLGLRADMSMAIGIVSHDFACLKIVDPTVNFEFALVKFGMNHWISS
jgi:hypothetical protein